MVRKQMERLGHATSLQQDLIPDEIIQRYVATGRYTVALRNERDLVRNIVNCRGFVEGLTLSVRELRCIATPTTMIYGSDDPVGDHDVWQRFVREMGDGAIHAVADSGHLPWYDKPHEVIGPARQHLGRARP